MSHRNYTTEELMRYLEDSDEDLDPFSDGSVEEYQPNYDEGEESEDTEVIANFIASSAGRRSEGPSAIPASSSVSNVSDAQWKRDVLPLEVQIGVVGEQRTHKIDPLIHKVINNFRILYIPSDVIVVDESMVKFHGKLIIRTYNPAKTDRYEEVVKAKLRRGEQIARQKDNLYTVLKWHDKRDVLMISTCHGDSMSNVTTKRGDVLKPDAIIDYNDAKKGIDISDQLALFHSPLRKSLTWYKKIAVDILFQVAIINARCIYNEGANGPKLTVLQVQEQLVRHLLGPAASTTESNHPPRSSIYSASIASSSYSGHSLQEIPRNANNKLVRKRCTGCYIKLKNEGLLARKAKQVHTECKRCEKAFCLDCYNEKHI
ncbi:hypothetical protein HF086_001079 [Spodoptera exigua]|uniref:PiggyBac transposable element-derived protein domain-containing protein n=1 Tax=Spodoptera exigua TaxID=7107 RepID=A0A922SBE3_SPOEX|nr:hypothetical protein HF086_001079 [Spodoptera exigua]